MFENFLSNKRLNNILSKNNFVLIFRKIIIFEQKKKFYQICSKASKTGQEYSE